MLSKEDIEKLSNAKGAKKIAVENFLSSLYGDKLEAYANLESDAKSYKWNAATKNAIRKGIQQFFK